MENKKELMSRLEELLRVASSKIELCEKCSELIPEKDLLTYNGSSCILLSSYESGIIYNVFICNECYDKNINIRELTRNIRDIQRFIRYNAPNKTFAKVLVGNLENWTSCIKT